jgi:O-antigen/teichoic acid export membrane protein
LLPLAFTQVFFSVFEVAVAIEGRIVVPKILKEIILRLFTALAFFSYYFGWLSFDQSVLLLIVFYFVTLFVLLAYFGSLRKLNLRPDFGFLKRNPAIVKDFFGYTAMVTIGSISGVLLTKLDFIMISGKIGVDATGVYAIAFHVATAIEIPQRALTQMLSPKVSELMKEGLHEDAEDLYKRTSVVLFLPALLLLLAVLTNLDNLYVLMPNGGRYEAGKTVIMIIAGAKALEMMSGMGQFILLYSRYYYLMFIMTICSLVVGVFLNLWLIPLYGITGAALATASTMLLQQLFIVSIIYIKFKFHSLTPALGYALLLFLCVFGLHFALPVAPSALLDLVLRGLFFPSLLLALLYGLRISPEINQQVDRLIGLLKGKK